jgi:hypothetical protein
MARFTLGLKDTNTIEDFKESSDSELGKQHKLAGKNLESYTTKNLASVKFFSPPCQCNAINDIKKALASLKRSEPLFLPAYRGGKAQILSLSSKITDSDACSVADGAPLCERVQFKFIDSVTLLEIKNFPHKGIAWDRST